MKLRVYQLEAKAAVQRKLATEKSTLVEMATGLGKTVLFAHIANEWPGRVLVIAHRDELIRQAADKIQTITGYYVAVEMGRERAEDALYGTKITVASIQTLARATRRSRFHPDHFSLLVVDEGHHGTANTYRETMDYFASAKRLFVTATPKRADEVALEHVCDSVAYQYGIEPAIDDGWLVPIRQSVVKIEDLDFSKARTVAEDFNQADLERILTEEKPLHAMVSSAHELIGDRQALWFCTSVAHAKATAAVLARYVPSSEVCFLSGDTPKEKRRTAVDAYKAGRTQHLLACMLFTEGFDAPNTQVIVMGRPTKSVALYTQILGRGTRPLPGVVDGLEGPDGRREAIELSGKPWMQVIDFAGNAGKHKIVQATDVLGGKYDPPVRAHAKKMLEEEGRTLDLEEALASAKEELEFMEEESRRRAKIVADAKFTTYEVSPFATGYVGKNSSAFSPKRTPKDAGTKFMASKGQAGFICVLARKVGDSSWTFDKALELTSTQASGVIGKLKARCGGL